MRIHHVRENSLPVRAVQFIREPPVRPRTVRSSSKTRHRTRKSSIVSERLIETDKDFRRLLKTFRIFVRLVRRPSARGVDCPSLHVRCGGARCVACASDERAPRPNTVRGMSIAGERPEGSEPRNAVGWGGVWRSVASRARNQILNRARKAFEKSVREKRSGTSYGKSNSAHPASRCAFPITDRKERKRDSTPSHDPTESHTHPSRFAYSLPSVARSLIHRESVALPSLRA